MNAEAAGWSGAQVADWCGRVTAPVLVLHGALDPRPLRSVERVAALLPRAELRTVPDAGHMLWRDNAPGFAAVLSDFLRAQ